jgi:hypothetical protein
MVMNEPEGLNSHDDPVVIDNGPFRLDVRGKKTAPPQTREPGEVARRAFTFFSQLVLTVIQGNDFEPPTVLRLTRTDHIVFHLAKGSDTKKVTLKWEKGDNSNLPYANVLVIASEIDLEPDEKGRLKARDGGFKVTSIEQDGGSPWPRSGSGGTLMAILVPETEPSHH